MKPIEQVIFTSLERGRETGCQVAARSVGVCEADARELVAWEPSRDSMPEMGPGAESFNFHPLPSGAYCISHTIPVGRENSGQQTYTHCLLVPPEVLARFANNPFALLRMMSDHDLWQKPGVPCPPLAPFFPPGGAATGGPGVVAAVSHGPRAGTGGCVRPGGQKRPMPGRGRHSFARALDCRVVQLPAPGMPAGVSLSPRA